MKKISLLLAIPIVLAASLVFGSLSFSVYGQESQTITPLGEQTANQTAAAANQTSAQSNQTSSQSSGGNLKLENILQWSNGAVQANEAGNGTGVTENLLKLQDYLKSSSGDKIISLPANQIGTG